MEIVIYQIDAFANKRFEGNSAAVCPLENWLPDDTLQNIAEENNLSETAFFVKTNDEYHIRWFTPVAEVNLCGHATLASAYIIFNCMDYKGEKIAFQSRSGRLNVFRNKDWLVLDFPVSPITKCEVPDQILQAFGKTPVEVWKAEDYMVVFDNEKTISSLTPDFNVLETLDCRGIIATAKGDNFDFVSRFFAPKYGINEDPVTGSAHCLLTPYWSNRLGKNKLTAKQISKRGGELKCELAGDRVLISGKAVKYLEGKIYL